MITPTVGRRVWFWPNNRLPGSCCLDQDQPFDAGVLFVHHDRMVNLSVSDHVGHPFQLESVMLLQDDDAKPDDQPFATWMPYQAAQAKKHEEQATPLAGTQLGSPGPEAAVAGAGVSTP